MVNMGQGIICAAACHWLWPRFSCYVAVQLVGDLWLWHLLIVVVAVTMHCTPHMSSFCRVNCNILRVDLSHCSLG
jgi:hypothetical protein